ncbi:MAG: S41 family peptidase, partial [Defluviitaleaceae bacterium]|nr:S41 family peptidase [Defluviitaleaceae bacterium]
MEAILADSQASESEEIELMYAHIMDAATFVAERNMTKFNQADLALLDYVMVSRSLVHPSYDAVGFDGEIWLLIDGNSASASSLLADMMQYAGMATLVGTNTSMVMSTTHLYVALPNTGIIWRADIGYTTNAYGQSLEFYGIAPDVRTPFGTDALDLALSFILGTIMNDDVTDNVTEAVADDAERGPLYFPGFPQIPTFITVSNNAEYLESGAPASFGLSSGHMFYDYYDYLILYAISASAWIPDTDAYDIVLANLGFAMQNINQYGNATWVYFYNAALDISLAYSFNWDSEMILQKIGPGNVYAQSRTPIVEDDEQDEDEYQVEDNDQDEDDKQDEEQENATDEGTTAFIIPAGVRDLLNDNWLRIADLSYVTVADSGFRLNSVAQNASYVAAANEVRLSILGRFDTFNWSAAQGSALDAIFLLVPEYGEDTYRPLQSFLMPQTNTDGTAAFLHIAYTDVRDFAPRSVVFAAMINDSGTLEMSMFRINWNHMNDDALARLHALSDALGINIVQRITSDMNSALNVWEMMANR